MQGISSDRWNTVLRAGYQQALHADQCSELYCSNRLQIVIDFKSLVFVPLSHSFLSCNDFRRCMLLE